MWFLIAIIGYFLLSIVFVLDKVIVSKSQKPAIYAFYSTIFMWGALFVLLFIDNIFLAGIDWLWALISGVSFGLALWTLYVGISHGEATHINPFNGAIITVFIFLFASFFLAEKLTSFQIAGIAVFILASLLLTSEKSKEHNGFHIGFIWAIISALFFAVSHTTAKYLYDLYPFWTTFAWTKAFTGVVGLLLLFNKQVLMSFGGRKRNNRPNNNVSIIVSNKVLGIVAVVLIQYAIAIGSVTLVNALGGIQYAFMFVLIFLATKIYPKFIKEFFTKREIYFELLSIVLIIVGSILFVL